MAVQSSMADALRLMRSGDLVGATAQLQAALGGGATSAAPPVELRSKRAPAGAPAPVARDDASGTFEARRHQGSAGALDYMLYRPGGAKAGLPLVVMLHGCTQSPEDFARGTAMNKLADELGFLVAYPRQTGAAHAQKCWNWFRPADQTRDGGEVALIAGVARDVIAAEGADPARVYIAGLSAGGAAAANVAAVYPDLFAAVGIHSGLACGVARDLPSALMAMKQGRRGAPPTTPASFVPVIAFHGDRDTTVDAVNGRDIVAAAAAAAAVPVTVETQGGEEGGRRFTRAIYRAPDGRGLIENWTIAGAGHAWSGGDPAGSYADRAGPDASRAMLRFFLDHRRAAA